MSLNEEKAPQAKSNFEPVPARVHYARCVGLIDLGVQKVTFNGEEKDPAQQVDILFELPFEKITIEKEGEEKRVEPRWMSKRINIKTGNKATLTKLKAALGIGKLTDFINLPVMLSVVHDTYKDKSTGEDRTIAKIDQILKYSAPVDPATGVPNENFVMPELKNGTRVFDFDEPSVEVWKQLPAFQRDYISKALNFDVIAKALEEDSVATPQVEDAPPVAPATEAVQEAPEAPPIAPKVAGSDVTGEDDPF